MRAQWYRCTSGAIGRRKSAVEDLLAALTDRLADEPGLPGDRVYVPIAQAGPLLEFARLGIIKCCRDGQEDAAGRFLLALVSVKDVVCADPWPSYSLRRTLFEQEWIINSVPRSGRRIPVLRPPRMVGETRHRLGITALPDELHALVTAARYCAAGTWPGIVAPVGPATHEIPFYQGDPSPRDRELVGPRRRVLTEDRGRCTAPRRVGCVAGRVDVCGAGGVASSTSGWTC